MQEDRSGRQSAINKPSNTTSVSNEEAANIDA